MNKEISKLLLQESTLSGDFTCVEYSMCLEIMKQVSNKDEYGNFLLSGPAIRMNKYIENNRTKLKQVREKIDKIRSSCNHYYKIMPLHKECAICGKII